MDRKCNATSIKVSQYISLLANNNDDIKVNNAHFRMTFFSNVGNRQLLHVSVTSSQLFSLKPFLYLWVLNLSMNSSMPSSLSCCASEDAIFGLNMCLKRCFFLNKLSMNYDIRLLPPASAVKTLTFFRQASCLHMCMGGKTCIKIRVETQYRYFSSDVA